MLRAIGAAALCLMAGAGCAARLYRRAAALRDMQARLYAMRASALYARADCGAILRAGGFDNLAQAAEIAGADDMKECVDACATDAAYATATTDDDESYRQCVAKANCAYYSDE